MNSIASSLEQLVAGDRTHRPDAEALSRAFLAGVVERAARWARIEKLVRGGTQVAYSNAALGLDLALDGDVMLQGEQLAEAERERLGLGPGPILELEELIDEQGIKILPCAFPPTSVVRGGFFFDAASGPCILEHADAPPSERAYILAHQYGHFLADYDPYIATLCGRPTPPTLGDPRELRAHQFALAFLMPRADLEAYRDGMRLQPPASLTADFARQLQVYFEADYATIFGRLLSLGWMEPQAIDAMLRGEHDLQAGLRDPDLQPNPLRTLPDHYVHLVASAFGRELLDVEEAAEYLGLDVATTARILSRFHYEAPSASEPAGEPKSIPPHLT